jgi:biopolymer transport protein ExbD
LLHAIPALNIFSLLLVFFLLGPSFVSQSGVAVDLPISPFQIERQAGAIVVSVKPGDPPLLWLEREPVTFDQLAAKLEERRGSDAAPASRVLLQVDKDVPVKVQAEVAQMALLKGFQVNLLGFPAATDEAPAKGE